MEEYKIGQVVKMKKSHPCGANLWKITRVGADFKIQCLSCKRSIMITRAKFNKMVKGVATEEEVKKEFNQS